MYYRLAELYVQVGDLIEIKGLKRSLVGVCVDVNTLGNYKKEYILFSDGQCYYYTGWHNGRIVSAFDKTI